MLRSVIKNLPVNINAGIIYTADPIKNIMLHSSIPLYRYHVNYFGAFIFKISNILLTLNSVKYETNTGEINPEVVPIESIDKYNCISL